MNGYTSPMSPATVAPVAGLPGIVVAAAGPGAGTSAATAAAGSTGGLLDAGALAGRALAVRRGVVAGPLGAAAAVALWPAPTAMEDRPLAMRELAEPRVDTGSLAASTGLDDTRARQGKGPGGLEARRDEGSPFTATPSSGRLHGTSVPAPLPPLPGLTPPEPLPPLAGFTPVSTPIHTTPGAPLDRPFLADAQVHIAPEVRAASNILERNELGRRMEGAGTVAPDEVAHHIVPGGGRQSGSRDPTPAQKALSDLGMDLHEPTNGVGLSARFHNKIHTSSYYNEINRRLLGVGNRQQAEGILQELEQDLKQADSDYQQTGNLPKWIRKKK